MIKKEIVQKIIEDNDKSSRETKELRNTSNKYQWSDSRIDLVNYISGLPDNDFFDLFALIDYGREVFVLQKQAVYQEFLQVRTALCCNLSKDEKYQKAIYFLKMRDISKYLNATLILLNETKFKF